MLFETFLGKFILNINSEHVQDYPCPGATFVLCSHEEKLPRSCPRAIKNSCEQLQASDHAPR